MDLVHTLRAFHDVYDQPLAVFGDETPKEQFAIVGAFIYELVFRLRRAQFVKVDLREAARAFKFRTFLSVGESIVEESGIIL